MSYGIALSLEAQNVLARLPLPVRQFALRQLEALGDHPTVLSVRSHFPYREKCQLFPFDYDVGFERWELVALFQYGQDEQTIYVITIGFSRREPWDGIKPQAFGPEED